MVPADRFGLQLRLLSIGTQPGKPRSSEMTDLAQEIAKPAPTYPVLLAPQDTSLLPLSGAGPFTVNVKIGITGDTEFSLPGSSTSFTDGVQWNYPTNPAPTSGIINFNFSSPITGFTSQSSLGLAFGPNSGSIQPGTVSVPPKGGSDTYHFTVNTPMTRKDPQIVVTPQ
jgi:hypothetical protein